MSIKWREVTWYSKLLAVIIVLVVVPFLAFHFGQDFENSPLALSPSQQTAAVANQASGLLAMITQMQSHTYPVKQTVPAIIFTRTLKLGSTGSDVVALQNYLISKGFMAGPTSDNFGKITKDALMAWQNSIGIIPASGILDTKSIKFLNDLTSSSPNSAVFTYSSTTPITTGTVKIIFSVDNTFGGTADSSNFQITIMGGNPSPKIFAGNATLMSVAINAGASYSVHTSSLTNYKSINSPGCSGNATAGVTATCSIIDVYVPPVVSIK